MGIFDSGICNEADDEETATDFEEAGVDDEDVNDVFDGATDIFVEVEIKYFL